VSKVVCKHKITQLPKKIDNLTRIVQNKIKRVFTKVLLCVAMSSMGTVRDDLELLPVLSRGAV
jgi:hypothetical protein